MGMSFRRLAERHPLFFSRSLAWLFFHMVVWGVRRICDFTYHQYIHAADIASTIDLAEVLLLSLKSR